MLSVRAAAQEDGAGRGGAADSAGSGGRGQGLSAGEVKIDLDRFGIGNTARRGDWTAIRLKIMDTGSKQRELIVRISGHDADGDTPWYDRVVTANPGVWQGVWEYVRLPFNYEPGVGLVASVYEALEAGDAAAPEEGRSGYRAGRMLGQYQITPLGGSVLRATDGYIAMSGQRVLGLRQYSIRSANGDPWHTRGHEVTEVAVGVVPADLPDRWIGYAPLDAFVWAAGDPAELRGERSRAMREWVERGGHLVVILPPVGQTWTNPGSNDLHDIMPAVSVTREESVELLPFRPMLTRDRQRPFPAKGVVHTFKPLPSALPHEARVILNGPDGKGIVVQRLVGAGAVTMIGLDLNQTAFSQFEMIDADVFWHRILGRRGSLAEPPKATSGPVGFGVTRFPWVIDRDIEREIVKSGRSAGGVLVGFVVFVLYWLVAGPVGFAILKRRKVVHHAWVFFVGAAGVFTAIAWGGATALRPARIEATHITLLDHVYGQPIQRARSWMSLLIPFYGTANVSVGEPGEAPLGRTRNLIASWDAPDPTAAGLTPFPDARGYVVDARSPDSITVPTRSTVKQLQADWAGGPRWEMPIPVGEGGAPGVIKLNQRVTGESTPLLEGVLVHNMPGTLRDVVMIVVSEQVTLGSPGQLMICRADAIRVSDWAPGAELDLSISTTPRTGGSTLASLYFDLIRPRPGSDGSQYDATKANERLTSIAFFPQLPPPDLNGNDMDAFAAQRWATHGWDLGRWFTQPCVIVVGHLAGETPVPFSVDGQQVKSDGRTVVRWVYPLPDRPPGFPSVQAPEADPNAPQEPGSDTDSGGEQPPVDPG